ncbi:MAG: outer membrane protein assembly factor BamD [Ignavibacteria bacterium]|nr:outer membrane protein assembly factor BamD [Ignavibacteria bacterium]
MNAKTVVAGSVMVLWLLMLSAPGCSSSDATIQMSAEERYARGMSLYEDEDYLEAIDEFRIVTLQFQGTALADDAQFMMGESRFGREEYLLAAYEYELLYQTMPTSEYVSRARYRRAESFYRLSAPSYLDQENTKKAIDAFQAFIEYYPTDALVSEAEKKIAELNSKLARKEYENGLIYMKMEYYRAAMVSFEYILEHFHDTPFAEPALLKKAEALYARKRYEESKEELERFLRKYPASTLKENAEALRRLIEGALSVMDTRTHSLMPSARFRV